MTAMYCSGEGDAQYLAGIVQRFAASSQQAKYQNKVLVTTFAGDQCRFGRGSALDGWNYFRSLLTKQNIPIYLMPSLFVDVYNDWYDGHFDWDSAWPKTAANLDTSRDQASIATLNAKGKGYMANISPAFFTYYGTSGQFAYNKNWIYRGDNWLLATRFEMLMGMRGQLDMIELTSWNGEFDFVLANLRFRRKPLYRSHPQRTARVARLG
jgi:glucan endo-1,3-alpha-glucosidase